MTVADKPIALTDIHAPMFTVGTLRDHVAPWRSTYKINLLTDTDVTYLLTVGGHNAGIVSEPGHDGRSFQIMTKLADAHYVDPETYLATAPRKDGSWWPEWAAWLDCAVGRRGRTARNGCRRGRLCAALRRARNLCFATVKSPRPSKKRDY